MNGSSLATLRRSATAAHVLPLAVFLLFSAAASWLRIENSALPWYQRAPEQWLYPLQTLVCGGLLALFRHHYKLSPWRCFTLAVLLAGLGIALWLTPPLLYSGYRLRGEDVPLLLRWLGVGPREGGFDPAILSAWPGWETAAVGMRFLRLVIVVPLVEEIFWRGFLMRYLAATDGDWESVPFGFHRWKAFFGVTFLVMLAHPQDYAAAFVWGALVYFLAVRSKSLGACVLMHAVGNLLLGVYIMKSHSWGLW